MRVLIFGGRRYSNQVAVNKTLDILHHVYVFTRVIVGRAKGADTLAETWAIWRGIEVLPFPAQWKLYGNDAGPIRNQQMIDEGKPQMAVGFPGGYGTADMLRRIRLHQIPYFLYPIGDAECPSTD